MTQPSPGFERLAAIHEWDDTHAGPPLFPQPQAPRPIPPVHHDTASVRRRARWNR
jgi:hypothetical protein